jgi:hypothetical protein
MRPAPCLPLLAVALPCRTGDTSISASRWLMVQDIWNSDVALPAP